jgi:hypothetical protein
MCRRQFGAGRPLMALLRPAQRIIESLVTAPKRKLRGHYVSAAFDPKRTYKKTTDIQHTETSSNRPQERWSFTNANREGLLAHRLRLAIEAHNRRVKVRYVERMGQR